MSEPDAGKVAGTGLLCRRGCVFTGAGCRVNVSVIAWASHGLGLVGPSNLSPLCDNFLPSTERFMCNFRWVGYLKFEVRQ